MAQVDQEVHEITDIHFCPLVTHARTVWNSLEGVTRPARWHDEQE